MKKDTHPTFYQAQVICACGNTFAVGTTIEGPIRVETCYLCHPFYTGKQKLVDTAGRVDRFRQRADAAKQISEDRAHGISAVKKSPVVKETEKPAVKKSVEPEEPVNKVVAKEPVKAVVVKKPAKETAAKKTSAKAATPKVKATAKPVAKAKKK